MSRVTELEKALTTLFRKGTEVGYTETEIDEFLENIDYHALLQAVWNKAETVYAYRADGKNALSLDYRSAELFKQRATLLYEDVGDSYMHYNPFAYIHSEKDILKLVTTLIANTKGEGKAGDDFWVKAETLLYTALIGYIHYEAPVEEQNFSTLIEFINAMEVREDDEDFKNPVDLMFEELKKRKPDHFAVRQYAKFKLSAGDICSK